MSGLTVVRDGDVITVGSPPAAPERTALVEARGALLTWDVLAGEAFPSARIHDLRRASEWLWAVYGPDAITDDTTSIEPSGTPGLRRLGWLRWARSWWPASAVAGIDPLAASVLDAELALETAGCEAMLDDEDAVTRALTAVDLGALDLLVTDGQPGAAELRDALTDLADAFGVALRGEVLASTRNDWALAAGDGPATTGVTLAHGTAELDWSRFPAGAVDAMGTADWRLIRTSAGTELDVRVPAAPPVRWPVPEPGLVTLTAGFGPIELELSRAGLLFEGRMPVPATVLALPAAQRVLSVWAPGFAAASGAVDRAAVLGYARTRLSLAGQGHPDASLAELVAVRARSR